MSSEGASLKKFTDSHRGMQISEIEGGLLSTTGNRINRHLDFSE
jgi:hypothetical protein